MYAKAFALILLCIINPFLVKADEVEISGAVSTNVGKTDTISLSNWYEFYGSEGELKENVHFQLMLLLEYRGIVLKKTVDHPRHVAWEQGQSSEAKPPRWLVQFSPAPAINYQDIVAKTDYDELGNVRGFQLYLPKMESNRIIEIRRGINAGCDWEALVRSWYFSKDRVPARVLVASAVADFVGRDGIDRWYCYTYTKSGLQEKWRMAMLKPSL